MKRRWTLVAVTVAALLAGGCGIPDETEVRPLRQGPSTGATSADDATPRPNLRADTLDRAEFVTNYLTAAAGDLDTAVERVKQFFTADAAANFRVSPDLIKVVRLVEDRPLVNPGSSVVTVRARQVGTLRPKGIFEPATEEGEISYEFTLAQERGQTGYYISKPPQMLLLSDEALETYYAERTIYFWNQERTGLIPDLRYLPVAVPFEQQPTQIIDWLTSGPSPWLSGVAEALPDGTKAVGNVPAISNGTLHISLSGQALPPDDPDAALDRLQKQMRWSLLPNLPPTLELTVEHAVDQKFTGSDHLTANPAYRLFETERFVVYQGQIRRRANSYNESQPVPTVRPRDNRNIRTAALAVSGSRGYAALVVDEGGRQVLKVGSAGTGEQAALRRIRLAEPVGRPIWAKSPIGADDGTNGLVTSGGKLFSFTHDGGAIRQVQWPGGAPGPITGVAVAPDAHRVALLAGGRLYVAALSYSEEGLQLSPPRVVHTVLREPTAVDWSSESVLVLAGLRPDPDRFVIMEVSIDGATQTDRIPELGASDPVTYLASSPAKPGSNEETSAIAYQQGGAAYDELTTEQLTAGDLAQPPADPSDAVPTAPFFLS